MARGSYLRIGDGNSLVQSFYTGVGDGLSIVQSLLP